MNTCAPGPFRVLTEGPISAENVVTHWTRGNAFLPRTVREAVDEHWFRSISAGKDVRLFDGLLGGLQHWKRAGDILELHLVPVRYRGVWYVYQRAGKMSVPSPAVLPRALGVSAVVVAHGHVWLMRRSRHVGECPGLVDVFGGHVELSSFDDLPDPRLAILRELGEELTLSCDQWGLSTCLGLIEVTRTCKPELVFWAVPRISPSRELMAGNDECEDLLRFSAEGVDAFCEEHSKELTPSALGSLWLFSRTGGGIDSH